MILVLVSCGDAAVTSCSRSMPSIHGEVESAVGGATIVVHRRDVRMIEAGEQLDLLLEAGQARIAAVHQEFDGRGAAQHGVAGAVDHTHAAVAELVAQVYCPSLRASRTSRRRWRSVWPPEERTADRSLAGKSRRRSAFDQSI